jgi:hypothetical protein
MIYRIIIAVFGAFSKVPYHATLEIRRCQLTYEMTDIKKKIKKIAVDIFG